MLKLFSVDMPVVGGWAIVWVIVYGICLWWRVCYCVVIVYGICLWWRVGYSVGNCVWYMSVVEGVLLCGHCVWYMSVVEGGL